MDRLNIVGIESPFGYRTIELLQGDLALSSPRADIVVVSVFAGGYQPIPGTVLGALRAIHGIDAARLLATSPLDLRGVLGVWLSDSVGVGPGQRYLFVELIGGSLSLDVALDNVFAAVQLIDAKGIETGSVVLPLLGAGHQALDADTIARLLVSRARQHLERAPHTSSLRFIEINASRARLVSDAIDLQLGRESTALPHAQLAAALSADALHRLNQARTLFGDAREELWSDWIRLLQDPNGIRTFEFGVLGRKLVETILSERGVVGHNLATRIRSLEETRSVGPWMCGYMHVLRHLGNESAHDNVGAGSRQPPIVAAADLIAGLTCVTRLLEFWLLCSSESQTRLA
ncbi:MAG: DUF4145 domain-containing protein [Chloroflexi bacterium]|nr:DUF4145 domain-containing protein [Chloroflexota bacterium]